MYGLFTPGRHGWSLVFHHYSFPTGAGVYLDYSMSAKLLAFTGSPLPISRNSTRSSSVRRTLSYHSLSRRTNVLVRFARRQNRHAPCRVPSYSLGIAPRRGWIIDTAWNVNLGAKISFPLARSCSRKNSPFPPAQH